jgi:hypothetical protein
VDLGLGLGTGQRHRGRIKRLLAEEGGPGISSDNILAFLGRMKGKSDYRTAKATALENRADPLIADFYQSRGVQDERRREALWGAEK